MDESGFKLFDKNNPQKKYSLPFAVHSGQRSRVVIWNDECDAFLFEDAINKWLQETLNMDCRLVYMPDDSSRYVDNKYAMQNETVSFADGYPVLIIGETSLQDLNNKLDVPVPMNRFRPNFVFSGGDAFEEDSWNEIKIGEAIFNGVKLCGRCVITTIDQDSGHASKEPLRTLSQYRTVENSVYFGQNLVVSTPGTVKLNDEIVLSSATIK